MPKVSGKADPHMGSPIFKYIFIIAIIALLVFVVAPKVYEIYNDNLEDNEERANG